MACRVVNEKTELMFEDVLNRLDRNDALKQHLRAALATSIRVIREKQTLLQAFNRRGVVIDRLLREQRQGQAYQRALERRIDAVRT